MTDTNCIACSMPLRRAEDHAMGDPDKTYCQKCAHEDGSMKSYDEVLDGMTGFITRTQGLDAEVAKGIAAKAMANLPAWQD